jgi:hypothetical protein
MRRHRFEPAALMMGLILLTFTTAFILDTCGVWDLSKTDTSVPLVGSGLGLVLLTAIVTQSVRIVRDRMRAKRP